MTSGPVTDHGNETMRKFGYPASLLVETPRWAVLLRPQQATLGALVLACREPVKALGQVSAEAFAEMQQLVGRIERGLKACFAYDKINYLALMMVDPDVHFHVIPRSGQTKHWDGVEFADAGWPALPSLGTFPALDRAALDRLATHLRPYLAG
jgi:diadenosine tetraphosphate (Ap4A) HIT family hydrolase